jgi:hypothetical protein
MLETLGRKYPSMAEEAASLMEKPGADPR